jgi:anti-anti-sigma factor
MVAGKAHTDAPNPVEGRLRIVVGQTGATTTLGLQGEWDLAAHIAMRQALGRALATLPERLVVDLSRLSFIGSCGVQTMISLVRRTERLNIQLLIVPGPRAVHRIFEICHLTDRLPFTKPREIGQEPRGAEDTLRGSAGSTLGQTSGGRREAHSRTTAPTVSKSPRNPQSE